MRRGFRAGWMALAVFLAFAPAGCNSLRPGVKTAEVQIAVAPGANDDSALQVDIVAVYDASALDRLLNLPAKGWFAGKSQILLDYPNGLQVWNWQLVPGTEAVATEIGPDSARAYEIIVYVSYATPGDHRARLGTFDVVRLTLGAAGFTAAVPP